MSYSLPPLAGFEPVEVHLGGWLSALGGVGPLMIAECDPASDACLGLRPGLPRLQVDAVERRDPSTVNDTAAARLAETAVKESVGADAVRSGLAPNMAAEDFAFMLEQVAGANLWIGNGPADGGRNRLSLHDLFNDNILPLDVQDFTEIARLALRGDDCSAIEGRFGSQDDPARGRVETPCATGVVRGPITQPAPVTRA